MKTDEPHFLSDVFSRFEQLLAEANERVSTVRATVNTALSAITVNPTVSATFAGTEPMREKGAKRSPKELEALERRLLRYVQSHPGLRIEQLAAEMAISTKELVLPMKNLIRDGAVKTKGQKRATSYTARQAPRAESPTR